MYSSRLVPRGMAWLGLIGGPLIILSGIGTLFGAWDAGTTVPAITVIPEFLWELSLGIYAAGWGFRRDAPILSPDRLLVVDLGTVHDDVARRWPDPDRASVVGARRLVRCRVRFLQLNQQRISSAGWFRRQNTN